MVAFVYGVDVDKCKPHEVYRFVTLFTLED